MENSNFELTAKQLGDAFAKSLLNRLFAIAFFGWLLLFPLNWIANEFRPTDSTDMDAQHRSGVKIITDAQTGKEYLVTADGGITPRIFP